MDKQTQQLTVNAARRAALRSICAGALASGLALTVAPAPARATGTRDRRRARMATALVDGFGVRYWGVDYGQASLAAAVHGLLIIEPKLFGADASTGRRERRFTKAEVAAIRRDGARPVFAYVNLAEAAPYCDYWLDRFGTFYPPVGPGVGWLAGRNDEQELLAAFWSPDWARVLAGQVDAVLAAGYDGVFFDDALHYFNWGEGAPFPVSGAPPTRAASGVAMMKLIMRMAGHARRRSVFARQDFSIIVNGAPFIGWDAAGPDATAPHPLFERYLSAIDGIAMESALLPHPVTPLISMLRENFVAAGISVLTIDFRDTAPQVPAETLRARVKATAQAAGLYPYLADTPRFDALARPIAARFSEPIFDGACAAAEPPVAPGRQMPE